MSMNAECIIVPPMAAMLADCHSNRPIFKPGALRLETLVYGFVLTTSGNIDLKRTAHLGTGNVGEVSLR